VQVEFLVHLTNNTLNAEELARLESLADEPHVTVIRQPMTLQSPSLLGPNRPRLGEKLSSRTLVIASIVPFAILTLTTAVVASPNARNHSHASGDGDVATGDHAAGDHDMASMDHGAVAVPASAPLVLVIEGLHNGKLYSPWVAVGAQNPAIQIQSQWTSVQLLIDDLPTSGLENLRVRFDLAGPGDVLIDDVQLFDLYFSDAEINQLKIIAFQADFRIQKEKYGDCLNELQGFWPQYLSTFVPAPQQPVANQPQQPNANPQAPPPGNQPPAKAASKPNNPLQRLNQLLK
jgi:hypothetical protein